VGLRARATLHRRRRARPVHRPEHAAVDAASPAREDPRAPL